MVRSLARVEKERGVSKVVALEVIVCSSKKKLTNYKLGSNE